MALGALLLLVGLVWAAGYCLDLIDEGYFYELGARVRGGATRALSEDQHPRAAPT